MTALRRGSPELESLRFRYRDRVSLCRQLVAATLPDDLTGDAREREMQDQELEVYKTMHDVESRAARALRPARVRRVPQREADIVALAAKYVTPADQAMTAYAVEREVDRLFTTYVRPGSPPAVQPH